ncbi:hypothetical protein HHI36_002471 [Cryptolaemus montrouzieri]|uniref:Uncharacterized protein n=1 Tax=Cryptolaemus montrouzieri TaxID=559131 RepID=A0ABD2PAK6_9CUCU
MSTIEIPCTYQCEYLGVIIDCHFNWDAHETDPLNPMETYLLDWQLSSRGSPLRDIAYFFYACSSKECFDTYITYLRIYHESASNILQKFDLNIEDIMTFDELQEQWKYHANFGMYMALLIIKIMLAEQEEAPDLKELVEDEANENMLALFNFNIANVEEYRNRFRVIIDYILENNFIVIDKTL